MSAISVLNPKAEVARASQGDCIKSAGSGANPTTFEFFNYIASVVIG
jgi:hypothetical protein